MVAQSLLVRKALMRLNIMRKPWRACRVAALAALALLDSCAPLDTSCRDPWHERIAAAGIVEKNLVQLQPRPACIVPVLPCLRGILSRAWEDQGPRRVHERHAYRERPRGLPRDRHQGASLPNIPDPRPPSAHKTFATRHEYHSSKRTRPPCSRSSRLQHSEILRCCCL
jgi:hypothetical protein